LNLTFDDYLLSKIVDHSEHLLEPVFVCFSFWSVSWRWLTFVIIMVLNTRTCWTRLLVQQSGWWDQKLFSMPFHCPLNEAGLLSLLYITDTCFGKMRVLYVHLYSSENMWCVIYFTTALHRHFSVKGH